MPSSARRARTRVDAILQRAYEPQCRLFACAGVLRDGLLTASSLIQKATEMVDKIISQHFVASARFSFSCSRVVLKLKLNLENRLVPAAGQGRDVPRRLAWRKHRFLRHMIVNVVLALGQVYSNVTFNR